MMVEEIFASILSVPLEQVLGTTTPQNTASWTSMAHIQLLVTLEEIYGVTFSRVEMQDLKSVARAKEMLIAKGVRLIE